VGLKIKCMYIVLHNIDNEKITTLETDDNFIEFVNKIAKENEDDVCFSSVESAKTYIQDFCPNLSLNF
jgi:hypothetical protein